MSRQLLIRPAAGFSMIEALVALIITAIGILGTVSMQGVILGNTKTANDHSIASVQLANLVGVMKSNQNYWLSIAAPFDISVDVDGTITDNGTSTEGSNLQGHSVDCTVSACNDVESAAHLLKQWAKNSSEAGFGDRMPSARAQIARVDPSPTPIFELKLEWNQKQAATGLTMSSIFRGSGSRTTGSYTVRVRP